MKTYVLVSEKNWHQELYQALSYRPKEHWVFISTLADFCLNRIEDIKPDKIFIPHWSYIIPESIWSGFDCVVFHMTDLPYGRGGSPLQNLIVRGHTSTKISALKVNEGLDTGDIYCKAPLSLEGSAQEIFNRATPIIVKMIEDIIDQALEPKPQEGEPSNFKRRKPEDGCMNELSDLDDVYDYIRMLDAEGYPSAFVELKGLRLNFTKARKNENEIIAHVIITKK